MSAKAGTIAAPGSHRPVWTYWVAATVVAGLLAAFATWAFAGRGFAPAVSNEPAVTVNSPVEAPQGPPVFRQGPNGESYPAPRVGR
jgi:hypothetical protein